MLPSCAAQQQTQEDDSLESLFATKDQQAAIADCLIEAGWDVRFHQDSGVIESSLAEGQEHAYADATAKCSEGLNLPGDSPLTPGQYRSVYDWYSAIAGCLSSEGWDTPAKPSFEVFVDTYDEDPWLPWGLIPPAENTDALEKCPVMQAPTAR